MIGDWPLIDLPIRRRAASSTAPTGLMPALEDKWQSLDLARRFGLAAAAVIVILMSILGWWVAGRIERGIIDYAVSRASQQFDSIVEPNVQDLSQSAVLSDVSKTQLRGLLAHRAATGDIVGLTIWTPDGGVVFEEAASAGDGRLLRADFEEARSGRLAQGMLKTSDGAHRLQISAPLHQTGTSRVIAVARMYEDADSLAASLHGVQWQTGAVVALLSLGMVTLLLNTVSQGSRTIADQRQSLSERVDTLSGLLQQNTELQAKLQDANRRSTDTNDRALRKIGAELHDGPVQLIALALLRLEAMRRPAAVFADAARIEEADAIESALRDALKEIRDLSGGLALPNLEGLPAAKAIEYAVLNHERRSRTRVKLDLAANLPLRADIPVLACLYRVTQESLNNAVRHAGGKGQAVRASFDNATLTLEISDAGPGMPGSSHDNDASLSADGQGLGLVGLRDRIESLGGTFEVRSAAGAGTTVVARIGLSPELRRS